MSFTGDVRFKTLLAAVLEKNELNGKTPYALYFATKNSNSGWSYGVPQYDMGAGRGTALFLDILTNAKDGAGKFIVDDGDPATDRAHDKTVLSLAAKAKVKGGTSLTAAELQLANSALSSAYGRTAIDNSLDPELSNLMGVADRVAGLVTGVDKAFLQSDIGRLFICDFQNQYGISRNGLFEKFVQGASVSLGAGTFVKSGSLGVDDLLGFYFRTKQASQTPWDPVRRFANVAAATGYTPADLDEAKGVLRAYTFLFVPNETRLTDSVAKANALNVFRTQVCKPADSLVLTWLQQTYGVSVGTYDDVLVGDDNANAVASGEYRLNGRGGNDVILGEKGNDAIDGGAGDDVLIGGEGDDTLTGGTENDTLIGGKGNDLYVWKAGDGQDKIIEERDADGKIHGRIVVDGGQEQSIETLIASGIYTETGQGTNVWVSPDGKIRVTHNSPWQVLTDNGGAIQLGETQEDFQDGDFGITLKAYSSDEPVRTITGDGDPVDFDPSEPGVQIATDEYGNVITDGNAPGRSDTLYGSVDADRIKGLGGTDRLEGKYGNDVLLGGAGSDILIGGFGDDRLYSGDTEVSSADAIAAGASGIGTSAKGDWLNGGKGDDYVIAGADNDVLFGGDGRDVLVGGAGDDVMDGDDDYSATTFDWTVTDYGNTFDRRWSPITIDNSPQGAADMLYGGAGNDFMSGMWGDDVLYGESGNDSVSGADGNDVLFGGTGDDKMTGDYGRLAYDSGYGTVIQGNDYLDGEDGNDWMQGEAGDDDLFGGAGNDTLYGDATYADGGNGKDYLDGEDGNDELTGGGLDDELFGGDGNDTLLGDAGWTPVQLQGNDYLDGEAGNDQLRGYAGDDELFGGTGADSLQGDAGNDYLDGEEDNDVLIAGDGNDTLYGGSGKDELQGGAGDDELYGDDGNDRLFGQDGNNYLDGGEGNDVLVGGTGNDTFVGGGGNDQFAGGGGLDVMESGDGNDELQGGAGDSNLNGGANDDLLFGEAGNDTLTGDAGNDQVQGGEGADIVAGGDGDDLVVGDGGNDSIYGDGGRDELQGGVGNDVLDGGADGDVLFGMDGDDTLDGGAGNDSLQGDAGADTYVFGYGGGKDTIFNFENFAGASDTLRFNVNASDVYAYRDGLDQVYRLKNSDDAIRVKNHYAATRSVFNSYNNTMTYYYDYRVERVTFADGTVWTPAMYGDYWGADNTPQYVEGKLGGGTGYGTSKNDTLATSVSGNEMRGGTGSDTYLWGKHTGKSSIADESSATDINVILVDASVSAGDVIVRRDGADAVLTLRNAPDQLRVSGVPTSSFGQFQVKFESDGTVWNLHDFFVRATESADDISGTSGNDSINGLGGNDTINSAYGVDTIRGGDGNDSITGMGSGQFYGEAGNDTITGGSSGSSGAVTVDGGDGNDVLGSNASDGTLFYGGAGNDTITTYYSRYYSNVVYGGVGDDTIYDDYGYATVIENADEGRDTVIVNDGATLGANVENLTIRYTGVGTGNVLDNVLTGGMYDNTLVGAGGNDTLDGGQGWDQLDGGAGDDTYLFARGGQHDTIVNEVSGTGAADRIVFAAGIAVADVAVQRAGDDLVFAIRGTDDQLRVTGYFASGSPIEQVQFADGTVWDTVAIQAAASYVPTEGNDVLGGTIGNDSIAALGGNDTVTGYAGDDTLDGGSGIDSLVGGSGNDLYIVDSTADVVSELAGEGNDSVQSAANYTLGANVENLTLTGSALTGTGNTLDNLIVGTSGANTLTGDAGSDTLDGGAGSDSLVGGAGNDTYLVDTSTDVIVEAAGGGTDTVKASYDYTLDAGNLLENLVLTGAAINGTGNGVANVITGTASANTLNGLAGNDTLAGGAGNDTYIVADAGDVIVENAGEGYDTVQSSVTYTLAANVEALTLTGTGAINGTGNASDNTLTGNSGANVLTGGAGNDTYIVSTGDSVVEALDGGTDTVQTDIAVTALWANVENVTLTGSARVNIAGNGLNNVIIGNVSNNSLSGGDGDDRLDGGGGTDTLTGGKGNDYFVIDDSRDGVTELAGEGTDTIEASFSYTLGTTNVVENLVITGAATTATGNGLANVLTGNDLANTISGLAGNDTMVGKGGDDTYVVAETGDVVIEEAGQGIDLVQSGVTYTLSANVENLTLTGTAAINGTGNALDNVLTGNTAANALAGGAGNDTYVVGAGDTVTENANEGIDTVQSGVTYTLDANIENLTLTGTGVINGTGNVLDNVLTGNSAANVLTGGLGNDTYYVGSGDTVVESVGGGTDTVVSSVAFTLGANVENLTLTGSTALTGNGNDGDNVLTGNAGANQLTGGKGNDVYVVSTGDTVVELNGEGTDTVRADVSFSLATFANVENLVLTAAAAVTATGNTLANLIVGSDGNNTLDGGAGADTMRGGLGDDTYVIDNAGDVVEENAGEGRDTIQTSLSFVSGGNIENVTLLGTGNVNATGDASDNVLTGNAGVNVLTGNGGNDTLSGGGGSDTLIGGAGNDTYVFATGVTMVENADEGIDTVQTTATYTLAANFENATLTGTAVANLTGNESNNVLTGNAAANVLDGRGGGVDTLIGGAGSDTLYGDAADVLQGGSGDDTYIFTGGPYGQLYTNWEYGTGDGIDMVYADCSLYLYDYSYWSNADGSVHYSGTMENATLTGTANLTVEGHDGNNVITGNSGNNKITDRRGADRLDGGAGNDTIMGGANATMIGGLGNDRMELWVNSVTASMQGGAGDDYYYLYNGTGTITELGGEGVDTVEVAYFTGTYTLGANLENLFIWGATGSGNELDNKLTGGSNIANTLNGLGGNDTLDGSFSAGADSLNGGDGNDTYIIGANDVLSETATGGVDTVMASFTYTLRANFENLVLTGSAYINGTGNDAANTLTGNSGGNVLAGGLGDDRYVISYGDTVVENAGAGIDTIETDIYYGFSLAGVANVENLVLTSNVMNGSAATGNALNNVLTGSTMDNTLNGDVGADTMKGGAGNDTYIVDNAADVVTENAAEGVDSVQSSVTYALALNVENITLTGANAIDATGNDLANTLTGNAAANVLRGGKGDDMYVIDGLDTVTELLAEGIDTVQSSVDYTLAANVENLVLTGYGAVYGTGNELNNTITGSYASNVLAGRAGDDTYVVSYGDTVVESAGEGTDTVIAQYNWTLEANVENLVLADYTGNGTGNSLANRITGNSSDNVLDGASGVDTLIGGAGSDTYVVDNTADDVRENAGEGIDRVNASVTYTLAVNVDNLVLTGTSAIDGTGNADANQITGNSAANTLRGNGGDDTLDGGAGADTLIGGAGDDTYLVDNLSDVVTEIAGEGSDTVQTSLGSYTLAATLENLVLTATGTSGTGNAGANVLNAQNGGMNTLAGGLGNDTYYVDAADVVNENAGEGTDTVFVNGTYTLGAELENLTLMGAAAINGTGNGLANVMTGNGAASVLTGGAGDDTYVLGAGDLAVESAAEGVDTVLSDTSQVLAANVENLTLTGTNASSGTGNYDANLIIGNSGNNTLDGGGGVDTLRGGAGNDTYMVDSLATVIEENAAAGIDTVISYIDYTIGANVENLTLTGPIPESGTGNALDNVITGNLAANTLTGLEGNDTLDGSFGADTLIGGTGDDTYEVENIDDVVVENVGEGTDTVRSKRDYVIGDNVENLVLTGATAMYATGNASSNSITGSAYDNVLDGGAGADTMAGGTGDDTYFVDNAGDVVTEAEAAGRDTVNSAISFTLSADLENLTLTGTAPITGTGNSGDNVLAGNAAANTLIGGAGSDTLDGGAGADLLDGGVGSDTYWVDDAGDVVVEGADDNWPDTVISSVDYTLGANLENLRLAGTAVAGTGNVKDNVLIGNDGNNVLDGGAGKDSMIGGLGDDTYVVDSVDDWVAEYEGEGVDEIRTSLSLAQAVNVEVLTLTGTADLSATGSGGNEILRGNAGANLLDGGAGVDIVAGGDGADTLVNASGNGALDGGAGNDTLSGSAASELFAGSAGSDTMTLGGGADIVSFNKGDGADVVLGGDGVRDDTISLGRVRYDELRLQRQGDDLLLKVAGTTDTLRLQGWYGSAAGQGIATLQVMVGSSSDYAPGSGDPLRDTQVKAFDFAQVVTAFDAAVAADPSLVEWTPDEGMLAGALVAASDTHALGGRLSWQYAQEGTVSYTHYLSAVTEMSDAAFGVSAQQIAEIPLEQAAGGLADAPPATQTVSATDAQPAPEVVTTESVYTAESFATAPGSDGTVTNASLGLSTLAGDPIIATDTSKQTQDTLAMRVSVGNTAITQEGADDSKLMTTTSNQWAEVDAWSSLEPALAAAGSDALGGDAQSTSSSLTMSTDLSGGTTNLQTVTRIENVAQMTLVNLQG